MGGPMKRVPLFLLLVLAGCRQDALHARIQVSPGLKATCVALDVSSPDGTLLSSVQVPRPPGKDEVRVAVFQEELPREVSLQARALWGSACEDALVSNGRSEPVAARFEREVGTFELTLRALTSQEDGDGDGFLSRERGGADCDDGRKAQNPGAPEVCDASEDLTCDGKWGCEDSACMGKSECVWPARTLVLVGDASVRSGQCSQVTVERRDAMGALTRPGVGMTVMLERTPSAESGLYEDAGCQRELSGSRLEIPARGSGVSFFVRDYLPGVRSLSATAPPAQPALLTYELVAPPPTQVRLTPGRVEVTANECLPLNLERSDALRNPVTGLEQTFSLAAMPLDQTRFFLDAGCATMPVEFVTLGIRQSSRMVYLQARRAGTVSLLATGHGLTSPTVSVNVNPGPVASLKLSPDTGQTLLMGQCSAPVQVSFLDAFGNPTTLSRMDALALSNTPANNLFFASDAACNVYSASIPIAAGASSVLRTAKLPAFPARILYLNSCMPLPTLP